MKLDRRSVLIGGGAGLGLVLAFTLWPRHMPGNLPTRPSEEPFGSFIKIDRNGRVTVAVPQVENGQGIWTGLPQIVADELGAAWESVGVEPAPLANGYANPLIGDGQLRITANATSIRAFEQPMREAAAIVRALLIGVAADRWKVGADTCTTEDNYVVSGAGRLSFGELAEDAADRRAPSSAPLRTDSTDRVVGRALPRLDSAAKSNGSFRFGGDVRLPGLLYAAIRAAPPGGRLTDFDRNAIRRSGGVRHSRATNDWVAVVADNWWQAERALKASEPKFSAPASPAVLRPMFEQALDGGAPTTVFERGNYDSATRNARALAATYFVAPSQHLGLEPLSATARVTPDGVEVWAGMQAPTAGSAMLYPLGVGEPAGRAVENEAVPIAIELARATGRAVQVIFSASASQNHDRPSPGAMVRLSALPSRNGVIAAWQGRVATANGLDAAVARIGGKEVPAELGDFALDGATPTYAIPDVRIESVVAALPVRAGYMRGSPQRELTFATESFIDELAHRAGTEPLGFRMAMLGSNGRLARCFQAAARRAQWDGGAPGSTMGIAGCSAFDSHIALVANASIGEDQRIKVDRLVAAVDCGRVVNSGLVSQQIEAGLIWALAQATTAAPEWVAGMPRARPIGGIALPRINDTPPIMVEIIPSSDPAGGIGGLGTTVLAPAVANAIFAATGRRLRSLPFDLAEAA